VAQLELVSVSKRYGDVAAVDEMDLLVQDNELFCLFGPPGCGKSTILRLLLGLETPESGEIRVGGRDVTKLPPKDRDLAMVFQNLALFPHMTVYENLAFPLVERQVPRDQIAARVAEVADMLHITKLLEKAPANLSGGERQRVAIGRALVRAPNAYLMDEPISALDARLREEMRVELNRLQRQLKHTFIHVTHDQEEAMAIADRLCIMKQGRAAQIGTPLEVYNMPNDLYVARQLGSPPINLIAGRLDGATRAFAADALPFHASVPSAPPVSGRACLGVRPEDIDVFHQQASAVDIPGEIYEVEPLGAITIVDVKAGGHIFKAQLPGQPKFTQGETAFLKMDLAKCHLFDMTSERRLATGLVS
jgi:multiple sugar transport system ATP-binding protein